MPRVLAVVGGCLAVGVIAVGLGSLLTLPAASDRTLLLVAIGVLLFAPLIARYATKSFDVLEPIVWLNAALTLMFLVRPIVLLNTDMTYGPWGDLNVGPTFTYTLVVVLVAIVAMYVGYFLIPVTKRAKRLRLVPESADPDRMRLLSWGLVVLAIALYGLFALRTGAPFADAFALQGERSTAYLYNAPFLMYPAMLMLLRVGLVTKRWSLLVVVALMVVAMT